MKASKTVVVRVVFDVESAPPRPLGTYLLTRDDLVVYETPAGTYSSAPADCVICPDVEVRL